MTTSGGRQLPRRRAERPGGAASRLDNSRARSPRRRASASTNRRSQDRYAWRGAPEGLRQITVPVSANQAVGTTSRQSGDFLEQIANNVECHRSASGMGDNAVDDESAACGRMRSMKEPYRVFGLAKVGNDGSSDDRDKARLPPRVEGSGSGRHPIVLENSRSR